MKTLPRFTTVLVSSLLGFVVLFAAPHAARGDTIDWGFDFFPTDSIDSFGTDLDASYTFYLGAFNAVGSFTPDRTNTGSWATNWTTFDSTGYNVGIDYFRDSAPLNDNLTFPVSTQAYIWGSNAALGDAGEWVLLSAPSWTFPSGEAIDPTVHEWFLSDTSVDAVVGAVDSTYDGNESGISFDASGGDGFDLQTEAVPEPAGALFFSISAIWFLFRRPRRATS